MGKRYVPCEVRNEYVQGAGAVIGAEGSHDDVYLRMSFGKMWEDLAKYVTFRDALGENPTVAVLTPHTARDGQGCVYDVPVPAAAKARQGRMTATVSGYTLRADGTQEDTATRTATAFFRVLPSEWSLAEDGSITPTIAQQLLAEIEAQKKDILDARAAAAEAEAWAVGQVGGEDVPERAVQHENNAKYYAVEASRAAQSAADTLREAQGAAERAEKAADTAAAEAAREAERALKEAVDEAVGSGGLRGPQGETGPQGPRGEKGDDGVIVDLKSGIFAMTVNDDGHLLALVNDEQTPPDMEIDAAGHLILNFN